METYSLAAVKSFVKSKRVKYQKMKNEELEVPVEIEPEIEKLAEILMSPKKKTKDYVNNEDLIKALMDHKEAKEYALANGLDEPRLSNYIGECFYKIAEGLSHIHKFINYSYREEMVGDGIENCLQYYHNYNPEKSRYAFAYFTQIIYYAFLRRIAKENKQTYVKYKATQQMGILDEHELMELDNGDTKQFEMYDNQSEFIAKYEEAKKKKKVAKKPKGVENFLEE